MRKKFTIKNRYATALKCVDAKYVKFLTSQGFNENIPFISDNYIQVMAVPLAEFGKVTPEDWFFEISHGVDWSSKNISPLDIGDVMSVNKQVFMYVPLGTVGSAPLSVSSKLAIKKIGDYLLC
jgi:hypothetical protein